jgi:Domain of unknown function (DUF6371)
MNQKNSYRFNLDNRRPTKFFHCPNCGKKEFKRYLDSDSGEYLPESVGRCNRENNCGYHYTPKQYFMDNPDSKTLEVGKPLYKAFPTSNVQMDNFSTIPLSIFERSKELYTQNYFVQYLKSLFEEDLTQELVKRFQIGTSKHWRGATVFWQLDELQNVRTGKIMLYNPLSGKRVKNEQGQKYIHWVHSLLKLPNYNLQQCLFGEHQLLNEPLEKTIAIVESEKTAILMTAILPDYIWLATGGLNNLKAERCKTLAKRKVILFPDLNAYDKWQSKETELSQLGCSVSTSDLLERYATPYDKTEGYDLADYFIKQDQKAGWAMDTEGYPLFWNNYSFTKTTFKNGRND